jgi:hypothetical protein
MALTKTSSLTNNFGEISTFEDAYLKVTSVGGSKESFAFELSTFKEQGGLFLNKEVYPLAFDLDGPNPIKQAYEYLKTLPEFSDATDC